MAATTAQIDTYVTNIRTAVTEYGDALATKQRLGKSDIYCDRVKLMLLSGYLDCIYDYFLQDSIAVRYDVNNFFTTTEIRDVMQHINLICGTDYMLVEL